MSEPYLRTVPDGRREDGGDPLMREVIGAALRRYRLEQGRTLREVADAAQVSLPYLSEVERGRKEPSSEVLAAVQRALGLRLIDLVGTVHVDLATTSVPSMPVQTDPGGMLGGHGAFLLAA